MAFQSLSDTSDSLSISFETLPEASEPLSIGIERLKIPSLTQWKPFCLVWIAIDKLPHASSCR